VIRKAPWTALESLFGGSLCFATLSPLPFLSNAATLTPDRYCVNGRQVVRQGSDNVPTVIRPTWQGTDQQRALIAEVNAAIEHAHRVSQAAEDAVWEKAKMAREAGVPDTQLCRITGLNRATLNRRLGSRTADAQEPGS
jgi:hypothetical protein